MAGLSPVDTKNTDPEQMGTERMGTEGRDTERRDTDHAEAEQTAGLNAAQARHADRLRAFVAAHGGAGAAVVEPIGRVGVRIVVVAEDGTYGDAVAPSADTAAAMCRRAGIAVADGWTRELSAKVAPSPADRRRMAGTGR